MSARTASRERSRRKAVLIIRRLNALTAMVSLKHTVHWTTSELYAFIEEEVGVDGKDLDTWSPEIADRIKDVCDITLSVYKAAEIITACEA